MDKFGVPAAGSMRTYPCIYVLTPNSEVTVV